jgi:hypothetical protein
MTEAVIRWRKLQDEDNPDFLNLTLPGITGSEMDGLCSKHVKTAYTKLWCENLKKSGKMEGLWEDSIKIYLQ